MDVTEADTDGGLVWIDDGVVVDAAVVAEPDRRVVVRVWAAIHHGLEDVDWLYNGNNWLKLKLKKTH